MDKLLVWVRFPTRPRIRTSQQQGNIDYRVKEGTSRTTLNQGITWQTHIATSGTSRWRGGRGGAPRRAVAESKHTVVCGSNRGKQITATVVHHANYQPESSYMEEFGYNYKEHLSGIARVFTNPVFFKLAKLCKMRINLIDRMSLGQTATCAPERVLSFFLITINEFC